MRPEATVTEHVYFEHVYFSTSCLHGLHVRCTEKGARCKFCEARCVCQCHNTPLETSLEEDR